MTLILSHSIRGTPVQWARARGGQGGQVSFHTAPEQARYKALVKDEVRLATVSAKARREAPLTLPLGLGVPVIFEARFFLPIPPSYDPSEYLAARTGQLRPTGKPDLDNWLKLPMDACEGILYANDSQVVGFGDTGAWYAEKPRLDLRVWRATADDIAAWRALQLETIAAVLVATDPADAAQAILTAIETAGWRLRP